MHSECGCTGGESVASLLTPQLAAVLDSRTGPVIGYRTIRLDPGSPAVFVATARMAQRPRSHNHGEIEVNSGAGLTEADAVRAAVGECVERYCAGVINRSRMLVGSWQELSGCESLVHPSQIALFADWQTDTLPRPRFDADSRVAWVPGTSLTSGRRRWVPAALVHIPYVPEDEEEIPGPAISTGLACWSSRAQAIVAGLSECIERDAVAITWLNQLDVPRLRCDEEWAASLFAERFARPNLHYDLFYIQTDLGVATILCLLRDDNFDPPIHCVGGAARFDVRDAVRKALIECVQGWTWARHERLELGPRPTPTSFEDVTSFGSRVRLYACADMSRAVSFLTSSRSEVRLSEVPPRSAPAEALVQTLAAGIASAGSDAVVIDLTSPDIADLGFSVVKVYCPGLEQLEGDHRYRLLGGTRWRTVPEKIGLARSGQQPNPWPHPYP
jgi:ribosomal protein S12 methylthiotransferase accessory factor